MVRIRVASQLDSDVIVVGAGPAGAAAAVHLARAGIKVILFDWQTFPRDKVCGDFVSPVALLELKKLGITSFSEYRSTNIIREAALYLDGQKLIEHSIPQVEGLPSYGRVIPRIKLDEWILHAAHEAGAEVLDGWRVIGFEQDIEGVRVLVEGTTEVRHFRTQLLIGADGSTSTIARLLRGQEPPRDDRIIAVRAYFEGIEGLPDQADLYFTAESFPGYYWLFPTSREAANVGVGMVLETIPLTSNHLRELLLRLIKVDAALQRRLRNAMMVGRVVGWPLTTYNPRLPIVGDRVMLIGDAAGLINPLNGEGIQYALLSGRWAAEVARSCVEAKDFRPAALSVYADRVERELRYDMALAGLIVQAIRNRTFTPIWLQALQIIVARARIDPDYAHIAGGILAGLVPASEAVSVKMVTGTLEQAAVTFGLQAVGNMLQGPEHVARVGLEGARVSYDIAYDAILHPIDFLKWSFGLAAGVTELAGQVSTYLLTSSQKAAPEREPAIKLLAN